jgi:hypothetical protein
MAEAWFRQLDNQRVEIFLKVERRNGEDYKLRASGPEEDMFELVTWFEERTGVRVDSPNWRRVRKGPRVDPSQTTFEIEATPSG